MAPSSEHGFSLIELMIVGTLVGVLAAVAVPALTGALRQYAVISASQQVAGAIRAARVQSVSRNQPLHVHFDAAAGSYQVLDDAGTAAGSRLSLPEGAQFVDADTDIEFDTSGRLDPALAPIMVVVGNGDAEDNRTITVAASGRVLLP
jgi:prepilin-type N-terminal cleavage/methylation domain-containing protein